jgi:hypothetical protein
MYRNKLECLPLSVTSSLVYYMQTRLEHTRMEPLKWLDSNEWLLAFPQNIRQGLKWLTLASILPYCDLTEITAIKSFKVQVPGASGRIRTLNVIIMSLLFYHCTTRGLYYKNITYL